jgi:hypothetical protein
MTGAHVVGTANSMAGTCIYLFEKGIKNNGERMNISFPKKKKKAKKKYS